MVLLLYPIGLSCRRKKYGSTGTLFFEEIMPPRGLLSRRYGTVILGNGSPTFCVAVLHRIDDPIFTDGRTILVYPKFGLWRWAVMPDPVARSYTFTRRTVYELSQISSERELPDPLSKNTRHATGQSATFALLRLLGVQRVREQIWKKGTGELAHDPGQTTIHHHIKYHSGSSPAV